MNKLIKLFFLTSIAAVLSGCEDQNTYQYLVTHPDVLKKKMDACATARKTDSNAEKQRCQIVTNASTKFMAVVTEQQTDAEKFGIRVLNAETAYGVALAKTVQLRNDLNKLRAANADVTAIHAAEEALAAAEKDAREKHQEVKMLLAVVGVSTPN